MDSSPKIGRIEGSNGYGRTGEHVPTGMFVFAAPGMTGGTTREPVSLLDFYPTLCKLLDIPAPSVDGTVIPEIVTKC